MPIEETLKLAIQHGLAAVICLIVLFKFFAYLERDKIDSINREKSFLEYINNHAIALQDTIKDHKNETKANIESLKEANRFQREEHKEMTVVLKSIGEKLATISGQIHI